MKQRRVLPSETCLSPVCRGTWPVELAFLATHPGKAKRWDWSVTSKQMWHQSHPGRVCAEAMLSLSSLFLVENWGIRLTSGAIRQLYNAPLPSSFMLDVKAAPACLHFHCPVKPSHLILISACNSILVREPAQLRVEWNTISRIPLLGTPAWSVCLPACFCCSASLTFQGCDHALNVFAKMEGSMALCCSLDIKSPGDGGNPWPLTRHWALRASDILLSFACLTAGERGAGLTRQLQATVLWQLP